METQRWAQTQLVQDLRQTIARIEQGDAVRSAKTVLPFGHPALDAVLPGGGLAWGALHEVAGAGPEIEQGAAATLFIAGILARGTGTVLWAVVVV